MLHILYNQGWGTLRLTIEQIDDSFTSYLKTAHKNSLF